MWPIMLRRPRRSGFTASISARRTSCGGSWWRSGSCRNRDERRRRTSAGVIEFCLVGAGFIGPVHAANVAAHPRARLSWVIDVNLDAADALAKKHGARAGRDLAQALADPSLRAVIVCTPPRTHATIIQAAANAGKAIFCEKPDRKSV